MIFKRLVNSRDKNVANGDEGSNMPSNGNISKVKFYSLKDIVKAERILNEVARGNLVFLNISRITQYPQVRNSFLRELKINSQENNIILKMVSDETIMIAPPTLHIEIKTLSSEEEE